MKRLAKLTIIGGGSTYTPELLDGFLQPSRELTVDEIALHDLDHDRLNVVGGLVQRMFRRAGVPTSLQLVPDRKKAIAGADFVVSQIRVGQMPARILDERIPLRYGALGQETVGAGGLFKALRTIPISLEIAREVSELAPDAWLLNFTNPSGIVTEALIKHGGSDRTIGLCNVPINSQRAVAELLGVPKDKVWLDWLGLNHLSWIRGISLGGRNVLSDVLERFKESVPESILRHFPFDAGLLAELRLLPSYYLRYYYMTGEAIEEVRQRGRTRGEVVQDIERGLLARYRSPELDVKPAELSLRGGAGYSEAALRLMLSLADDRRDVQTVITRNGGALQGLPEDASIEAPAVVGAHGVTPLIRGMPPPQVAGLLNAVKTSESLVIEAAIEGSRTLLLQALLANPLVPGSAAATKMMDELLSAHREHLPRFR